MTRPKQITVFALIGLIWGSEWIIARDIQIPPLAATAIRYASATVILAGIIALFRVRLPGLRQIVIAALTGFTLMAFPSILTIWASNRVSPGLVAVILSMTPLIAALMEGRAEGGLLVPLIGGVAGTAVLASQGLSFAPGQAFGAAALLAAAVLIAGSLVYIKRRLPEVHMVAIAATQLAGAAVCCGLVSLAIEGRAAFSSSRESICRELILGILASALAYPLYYWLLKQYNCSQLTSLQWMATVVGVAEGLIFLREAPTRRMVTGMVIALASMGLLLRTHTVDDDTPLTMKITLPPNSC